MPPAYVQSVSGGTLGTSSQLTLPSNVTAGSLLLLMGRTNRTGATTVSTISDSVNGAVWGLIQQIVPQANVVCFLAYTTSSHAGACTVTLTLNGSGTMAQSQLIFVEYSGVQNAVFDAAPAFATGSSSTPTAAALTTTGAQDLVIFFAANETTSTPSLTPPAGYTQREVASVNSFLADKYPVGPGTYTLSATAGAGVINWECLSAAFLGIPAPPPVTGGGDLGPGYDFRFRL